MNELFYSQMFDDLMKLTLKELKQIAREEGVCLGYASSRKDLTCGEIVAFRRHQELVRGGYVSD